MIITFYVAFMVFISIAALAAHQMLVAVLATGLMMIGGFVHRYQDHPVVREWMEQYF